MKIEITSPFVSRKTAIEWEAGGMRKGRDADWLAALRAKVEPHAEELRKWFNSGIRLRMTVAIFGAGNSIHLLDVHDAVAQIADQLTDIVVPREKGKPIPQTADRHVWHVMASKAIDPSPRVEIEIEPLLVRDEDLEYSTPRTLKGTGPIGRRLARLNEPHMEVLTAYVKSLRESTGRNVPDFDPVSGGTNARVLLLLESPGPMAAMGTGSGFISPNNDDDTAATVFTLLAQSGLDRYRSQSLLFWNMIPWFREDRREPKTPEIREGAAHLTKLLRLLPKLRVVVLMGNVAKQGWEYVEDDVKARMRFAVHRTPHPSGQGLAFGTRPERREEILRAFQEARRSIEVGEC